MRQNAIAALACAETIGITPASLLPALAAFRSLAPRPNGSAEIGGPVISDDSKGTNVGATLAASRTSDDAWRSILGGDGKGDFSPLRAAVSGMRAVALVIGRDASARPPRPGGCCVAQRATARHVGSGRWCINADANGRCRAALAGPASMDMYRTTRSEQSFHRCRTNHRKEPPDAGNGERTAPPAFGNRSGAAVEHYDAAGDQHGHGLFGVDGDRRAGRLTGNQPTYFLTRPCGFLAVHWSPAASRSGTTAAECHLATASVPWLFVASAVSAARIVPDPRYRARRSNGTRARMAPPDPPQSAALQIDEGCFAVLTPPTTRRSCRVLTWTTIREPSAAGQRHGGEWEILFAPGGRVGAVVVISIAMGIPACSGGMHARALFLVLIGFLLAAAFAAFTIISFRHTDAIVSLASWTLGGRLWSRLPAFTRMIAASGRKRRQPPVQVSNLPPQSTPISCSR